MTEFDELTWDAAMRRAYAALMASERLYDEIDAAGGRSNIDIEKHLRRSEVKATQAQVWLELARELGREDHRYGHSTT
jgi:predicted transcriptional regulator